MGFGFGDDRWACSLNNGPQVDGDRADTLDVVMRITAAHPR
ncbi:MAG: hypothetical protein QM635_00675 [Microbacteriaceae bacterium]